jgi:hypothetical protein
MPDLSHVNWVMLAVVGIAVAIGWTILRIVLRLTMRMFALGCVGLLLLAGVVAAVAYFSSR